MKLDELAKRIANHLAVEDLEIKFDKIIDDSRLYPKEALIVQKQIDALNNKKAKLEENKSVMILAKSRLEEIEKIINSDINGFDEDTFTNLVDEVIIRKRYELEFKFKCGISKKWLAK